MTRIPIYLQITNPTNCVVSSDTAGNMGGAVSSGSNNDDLINKLVEARYIKTPAIEQVFRAVDRAFYFLPNNRSTAYKDIAWKQGNLHISAPCIYSEVLENLKVQPGNSFLNLGSGTGYLSTMVGLLLGPYGMNHGVEVHKDVIEYAVSKLNEFKETCPALDSHEFCEPVFLHGNSFLIHPSCLYDRVYCGAACTDESLEFIRGLIKIGGILVAPCNEELLKLVRISENEWKTEPILPVSFSTLIKPDENDEKKIILPDRSPIKLSELCRFRIRSILREIVEKEHPELIVTPYRVFGMPFEVGRSNWRRCRNRRCILFNGSRMCIDYVPYDDRNGCNNNNTNNNNNNNNNNSSSNHNSSVFIRTVGSSNPDDGDGCDSFGLYFRRLISSNRSSRRGRVSSSTYPVSSDEEIDENVSRRNDERSSTASSNSSTASSDSNSSIDTEQSDSADDLSSGSEGNNKEIIDDDDDDAEENIEDNFMAEMMKNKKIIKRERNTEYESGENSADSVDKIDVDAACHPINEFEEKRKRSLTENIKFDPITTSSISSISSVSSISSKFEESEDAQLSSLTDEIDTVSYAKKFKNDEQVAIPSTSLRRSYTVDYSELGNGTYDYDNHNNNGDTESDKNSWLDLGNKSDDGQSAAVDMNYDDSTSSSSSSSFTANDDMILSAVDNRQSLNETVEKKESFEEMLSNKKESPKVTYRAVLQSKIQLLPLPPPLKLYLNYNRPF